MSYSSIPIFLAVVYTLGSGFVIGTIKNKFDDTIDRLTA